MIKQAKYTYNGLNQDVSKSKHTPTFYFDAKNIIITNNNNQSKGSVSNELGNDQVITLPEVCIDNINNTITYNKKVINFETNELDTTIVEDNCDTTLISECSSNHIIIGHVTTRDSIVLISTDNNGFDCVWEVKGILDNNYNLTLLYVRNMNLSSNNPIQIIYNYENEIIEKIYFVDGNNQLRFLNLRHDTENGDLENLIDLPLSAINQVSNYQLSQPSIDDIFQGGIHTAGVIQYAYNLYKLNGSQTNLSPVSELCSLDKGDLGGGELNEIVGQSPKILIPNLDTNFTNIKLYAIKYTSYNELPEVTLLVDEEIGVYTNYSYIDNGQSLNTLSLEELLFLGSNPTVPQHIETKDNRLFSFNLKELSMGFKVDTRAYSFDNLNSSIIIDNISPVVTDSGYSLNPLQSLQVNNDYTGIPEKFDCINPDYDKYRFQKDGATIGGEGKNIKYEILTLSEDELQPFDVLLNDLKVFKNGEVYRLGIKFYNLLGQSSTAFWIADYKMPELTNLQGKYCVLRVELKPEFYDSLSSNCLNSLDIPVGYKALVAERTSLDKTIYTQGCLQGMFVQTTENVNNFNFYVDGDALNQHSTRRENIGKSKVKTPMLRAREYNFQSQKPLFGYKHTRMLNESNSIYDGESQHEIFTEERTKKNGKRQQSWQDLKMMQMYSPEILFDTITSFDVNTKLKIIGGFKLKESYLRGKELDSSTLGTINDNTWGFNNNISYPVNIGPVGIKGYYIGPTYDSNIRFMSEFKSYKSDLFVPSNKLSYSIYGKPEIPETGAGVTTYNGDSEFKYTNNLLNVISDENTERKSEDIDPAIKSINSNNIRNATVVLGSSDMEYKDRPTLDKIFKDSNFSDKELILIAELVAPDHFVYTGGIYGGITYEAKSRTSYLEVGSYSEINTNVVNVFNPGDIFVHNFNFARLIKTDTQVLNIRVNQLTNILEYLTESTIDLNNRNDLSINGWDSKFQPKFEDYHKYNKVYSQLPTLFKTNSLTFNSKIIEDFDTRVRASKQKVPNEDIDSFTDILENELLDLDGKYGAINSTVNFKDEIYTLQDSAVSKIIINPRAQVQSLDGLSLELGRGGILYDYNYITTESGSINKWGTVSSPSGFYYIDALNKAWMKFQGGIFNITDTHGLHAYFENNINYNNISTDNPILNEGVSTGYNVNNRTCYLSILNNNNPFTISFNEVSNSFESFKDYIPSRYINKGDKMFTLSKNNNDVWEHEKGDYQTFYGEKFPSYVTLMVNPESDLDCVFNNIEYKSEIYLKDIDQPNKTLTHIKAYNEYQDTGKIQLTLGRSKNLRRKFRNWQAQIPRNKGSRDRIRNPWIFLKLELDAADNYKMILHDIIVHYTTY